MKLAVVGLGHCGTRIADEFARVNQQARSSHGVEIVTSAIAVDTDIADMESLSYIRSHYQTRIIIGGRKAGGHGVGKINEKGAEIAKEDGDKIISAMRGIEEIFHADAFMLTASTGGGTGSGSLPVVAKLLKDRYGDKPIYALVVLPFDHEEATEERTIYNTGTCLKSIHSVANAVFLVTNEKYINKESPLKSNLSVINTQIVEPFLDLLSAGEEKKQKYVGAKVIGAGDIIEALSGWTVMGVGRSELPLFKMPFWKRSNNKEDVNKANRGIDSVDAAMGALSLSCNIQNAKRILYMLSAPQSEININLIKEVGDYLKNLAPNAIIAGGDYPQDKRAIEVLLVLSGLKDIEKIKYYFNKSSELLPLYAKKQKEDESKLEEIDEAGKNLPSLLT